MNSASDIIIPPKTKAAVRINGYLQKPKIEQPPYQEIENFLLTLLSEEQKIKFRKDLQIDFAYIYREKYRFRANLFHQQNGLSLVLRLITANVPDMIDLGLPPMIKDFIMNTKQGLVLVSGPTGHGKTTTLAAILNYINDNLDTHIITVEDPIEHIISDKKSIVEQRELGDDTHSFAESVTGAMRQNPDVLAIGEMRDLTTIKTAITMAETGHLVLSTVHTNSAPQTIDRIIDTFPMEQQSQIIAQLANSLEMIISQRLIPVSGSEKRVLAYEMLIANDAVRSQIRTNKIHMIKNVMQTSTDEGMITLDKHIVQLIKQGKVPLETAQSYVQDVEGFRSMMQDMN